MKRGEATLAMLLGVLERNRARLTELAPVFLAQPAREQLVGEIFKPQSPHGIVARMICTVLAEETQKPRHPKPATNKAVTPEGKP
jgi:hypothetical protein